MKSASGREERPVRHDPVRHDLDGRYGTVAMPALAAALRYQSDSKNPEYAPTEPAPLDDRQEAA